MSVCVCKRKKKGKRERTITKKEEKKIKDARRDKILGIEEEGKTTKNKQKINKKHIYHHDCSGSNTHVRTHIHIYLRQTSTEKT